MFFKRHILALCAALSLCLPSLSAAPASIKATLDSAQLTMGNVTCIRLNIVENENSPAQFFFDPNSFPKEVEPVDWLEDDTTSIGNGMREIKRALIVQSFDSGVYTLPPFFLVTGNDTVKSNQLTIKVQPVDVSQMKDINPIAPVKKFKSKWYDFLPDWLTDYWLWILLGLVVVAGGVCAYLIFTRKVEVNILPKKKKLPPYELAIKRLTALREKNLCENGMVKEYYTVLIDILRDYLQGRFGINAMEMTSTDIVRTLSGNDETRHSNQHMRDILQIADYVKFAAQRPLPDDNVRAFNDALDFVEETKPAPVPEDGAEGKAGESAPAAAAEAGSENKPAAGSDEADAAPSRLSRFASRINRKEEN